MPFAASSRLDSWVRRAVPSASLLSYNRAFRLVTNPISRVYQSTSPMFDGLPPNHLRVRVGVGNELLFNHARHLIVGEEFWLGAALEGWFSLDADVLDIGVGCGRYARHLRDYSFYGTRYTGQYTGVDIDEELIAWCRANFPADHFRFVLSTHTSDSYRSSSSSSEVGGQLAVETASKDLVFSRSLYSHLLPDELEDYVRESARVLRPGGYTSMTYFSLTSPPPTMGARHTFSHPYGIARVESLKQPTAAVAYHDEDLRAIYEANGFEVVKMTGVAAEWQQMILARRR